ncbi:hypothetical protein RHSIM_Rhsim01G0015000 [Rhododendron simsii]|uniref:F-box domain-containing protein n=1 Tax=Rhododendron simsii TaxID=118357 RepID=A0A834LXW7_RHOSS|nr:hypothetical protein RHSIM_Rhsim01G0015000 [Rhododendron simsii]
MTRKASNKRTKAVLNVTPSDISPVAELIAANIDLLTEILLRLPAKSTIRFKSVSKHWLSLLSDSQFATNHSTRNPRPSAISGLYFNSEETLNFVSLHGRHHNLPSLSFLNGLRERFRTIKVAHSCNGLLLCYTNRMMSIDRHFAHYNIVYIVCNPTTKKYTLLPKRDGVVCDWSAYLVFDPSQSPRHYKVVLVGYSPGPSQIDVYSSQSLCWRKIISYQEIFGRAKRDYSSWVVKCQVNLRALISAFPEMESRRNDYRLLGFKVLCAVEGESERRLVLLLAIPGRIVSYNPKKRHGMCFVI